MSQPVSTLAALLEQENALLRAHQPHQVAALLPAKEAAIAALGRAGADAATARRLLALATENRALLTQALDIQKHILAMVARATQTAMARNAPYGSPAQTARRKPPPVALSARC